MYTEQQIAEDKYKEINNRHTKAAEKYKQELTVINGQILLLQTLNPFGDELECYLTETFDSEPFKSDEMNKRLELYANSVKSILPLHYIPKIPEGIEYIPFLLNDDSTDQLKLSNDSMTIIIIWGSAEGKQKAEKFQMISNELSSVFPFKLISLENLYDNQSSGEIFGIDNHKINYTFPLSTLYEAYNLYGYSDFTIGVMVIDKNKKIMYNRPYTKQTFVELKQILETNTMVSEHNEHWRLMFPEIYPFSIYSQENKIKDENHDEIYITNRIVNVFALNDNLESQFVCSYSHSVEDTKALEN